MMLVHKDGEITNYNGSTNKYYTSRNSSIKGPLKWDYRRFIEKGLQTAIGPDVLGWWTDD